MSEPPEEVRKGPRNFMAEPENGVDSSVVEYRVVAATPTSLPSRVTNSRRMQHAPMNGCLPAATENNNPQQISRQSLQLEGVSAPPQELSSNSALSTLCPYVPPPMPPIVSSSSEHPHINTPHMGPHDHGASWDVKYNSKYDPQRAMVYPTVDQQSIGHAAPKQATPLNSSIQTPSPHAPVKQAASQAHSMRHSEGSMRLEITASDPFRPQELGGPLQHRVQQYPCPPLPNPHQLQQRLGATQHPQASTSHYVGSQRAYAKSVDELIRRSDSSRSTGPNTNGGSPKEKYRRLKKKFKLLIYENECYQEELRNLQRKLLKLSRDKNFLLDRLLSYEGVDSPSSEDSDSSASEKTLEERSRAPTKRRKRLTKTAQKDNSAGGPKKKQPAHSQTPLNSESKQESTCR